MYFAASYRSCLPLPCRYPRGGSPPLISLEASPVITEVRFRPSLTLLIVQAPAFAYGRGTPAGTEGKF